MASRDAEIDNSDHYYNTSRTIARLTALGVITGEGDDDSDDVIKKTVKSYVTDVTEINSNAKQHPKKSCPQRQSLEKFDSLNEPPPEDDDSQRWTDNTTRTNTFRSPGAERIYPTGVPPSNTTITNNNDDDNYSSRNIMRSSDGRQQQDDDDDDDDDDKPLEIIATLVTDDSRRIPRSNDEPVLIAIATRRKCFEVHMNSCPKCRRSTKIAGIGIAIALLITIIAVAMTHPPTIDHVDDDPTATITHPTTFDDPTITMTLPTTPTISPTFAQPTPSPGQILPLPSIYGKGAYCYTGYAIALSDDGRRIAIGYLFGDSGKGMVQIFERRRRSSNDDWSPVGGPIVQTQMTLTLKGHVSLSDDGDVVAIFAHDPTATPFVVARRYVDGDWQPLGRRRMAARAASLSRDGRYLAIVDETYRARVFFFDEELNDWILEGSVMEGRSTMVKLSGDARRLAVSYCERNEGRGEMRAFELTTTSRDETTSGNDATTAAINTTRANVLRPLGSPIVATTPHHYFGWDLSLSHDGSIVAIGTRAGNYVRVVAYDPLAERWMTFDTLRGETIDGDTFGSAVALSGSGGRLAVGMGGYMIGTGRGVVYEWDEIGERYEEYGGGDGSLIIVGDGVEQYEGNSVAMAGDGRSVAVGAPFVDNGEGMVEAGRVRVFTIW